MKTCDLVCLVVKEIRFRAKAAWTFSRGTTGLAEVNYIYCCVTCFCCLTRRAAGLGCGEKYLVKVVSPSLFVLWLPPFAQ